MSDNIGYENMKLVLDDEYIREFKAYMTALSEDANRKLEILLKTVDNAREDACVSGKSAEVLANFSQRLSLMSGCILEYGRECVALAEQFCQQIEEIDGDF